MGKWDGSFHESKYKETGNMVHDVIENSGRIVHESTCDGFTHEVVDRGGYLSDDYYFPNRHGGGKAHIHYEHRSDGKVLIDGKEQYSPDKGESTMAKHFVRSRGMDLGRHVDIDSDSIKNETNDRVEEGSRLGELGKEFNSDKEKLEDAIDRVKASKISDEDKAKMIRELNDAVERLQEEYDTKVAQEEEKVQEEIQGQIETMEEASEELGEQVDSLRGITMDAASADAQAAADEGEAKKQEFETMKQEYVEKLELQMQQAEMMRREIRTRRLRGR